VALSDKRKKRAQKRKEKKRREEKRTVMGWDDAPSPPLMIA
jgi:hypothetical protein